MSTLKLQLVFDPANQHCSQFGRFLHDAPNGLRSKVWILDSGTPTPDSTAPTVTLYSPTNPNTPQVQVAIIASFQTGYGWGIGPAPHNYSLKIFSVFGRAVHANPTQDYASPFGLLESPSSLATIFESPYTYQQGQNETSTMVIGQARFGNPPTNGHDSYAFNIGALAYIKGPSGAVTPLYLGHDPDMDVGN
jgi:hypothetical protein